MKGRAYRGRNLLAFYFLAASFLACEGQKKEEGQIKERGKLDKNQVQAIVAQKLMDQFMNEAVSFDKQGQVSALKGFSFSTALKESQDLYKQGESELPTAEVAQRWQALLASEQAVFDLSVPAGTKVSYSSPVAIASTSLALSGSGDLGQLAEQCKEFEYREAQPSIKELLKATIAAKQCGSSLRVAFCMRLAVTSADTSLSSFQYLKSPPLDFALPCQEQAFGDSRLALSTEPLASTATHATIAIKSNPFVASMYVSPSSDCSQGGDWTNIASELKDWALVRDSQSGEAHIYAKFRDIFGSESECFSYTLKYALASPTEQDTQPPSQGSLVINAGDTLTNSQEVSLSLQADDAYEMYLSNSPDCSGEGVWETFSDKKVWALGQTNVEASVSVKFRDMAGNESSCSNDVILHDNIAPASMQITINGGASDTSATSLSLSLAASGASEMYLSSSAGCEAGGQWEPFQESKTWTVTQTNAVNTLYAAFRDLAGNVSPCLTSSINHDDTAPGVPANFDDGVSQPISTVGLSWGAASDNLAGIASYSVALGSTSGADDLVSWTNVGNVTSYTLRDLNLTRGQTYFGSVRAIDRAGNQSAVQAGDGFTATHKVTAVISGREHNCVLLNTGKAKCWGYNNTGQLGQGNASQTSGGSGLTLAEISGIALGSGRTATSIALGASHSCALLDNGEVKCWGYNATGQLGQGSTNNLGDGSGEMSALAAIPLGATASQIAAGNAFTCALLSGGNVKCWGKNNYGQLGQGHVNTLGDEPNEVGGLSALALGDNRTASEIAVGHYHGCALLDNSSVKCWGKNDYGQLGVGHTNLIANGANEMGNNLVSVDLDGLAAHIFAGEFFSCALLTGGSVKCWGQNTNGQLGQGHSNHLGDGANEMGTNLATIQIGSGRTATQLALGLQHACVLLDNGAVKCWGSNSYGQLGQGHTSTLGDGSGEMGDQLAAVDLGSGRTATKIAAGSYHNCALLDNNALKCWGYNWDGQLGLGHIAGLGDGAGEMGDALASLNIGVGRTASFLAAGASHSCALLDNGSIKCWGQNLYGQLGQDNLELVGTHNGTSIAELSGLDLGTGRTITQIDGGLFHSCALLDNGRVKCWGTNDSGQIGLGTSPAIIGDGANEMGNNLAAIDLGTASDGSPMRASAISLTREHSCALLANGKIKCWGANTYGQLGQGHSENLGDEADEMGEHLSELSLGSGRTAVQLESGRGHNCALLDNGRVKCWGLNDHGQLGLGHANNYGDDANEPVDDSLVAIDLGSDGNGNPLLAAEIATGDQHSCARFSNNGKVKCWGYNFRGQLGHGSTTEKGSGASEMGDNLIYTDLGSNRTAVKIAAGVNHSCAILDNGQLKCWGDNAWGVLGQGDTTIRGDGANEMGDNLAAIDLGSNRTVVKVAAKGYYHICALLDNETVKCWGRGAVSKLGQGTLTDIGSTSGQMGDSLPALSIFP